MEKGAMVPVQDARNRTVCAAKPETLATCKTLS